MTYRLNPALKKILSPVTLTYPDGRKNQYQSGADIADETFEKKYLISSMKAIDSIIEIKLEESSVNVINWMGEEAISFF